MKNLKKINFGVALAMLFVLTTSSMCSTDDDSIPTKSNPIEVINIVKNGTWRITYYFDTDQEETSKFNGYNFTFGANNVLTASNGTNNYKISGLLFTYEDTARRCVLYPNVHPVARSKRPVRLNNVIMASLQIYS